MFNDIEILTEVTAYHGSAYDFDKFDVKYIGKGEHGQAHGWGLYFSLGVSEAQGYRRRISSINKGYQFQAFTYNGKSYKSGTIMYSVLNILANKGKKDAIEKLNTILADKDYIATKDNIKEYLEKIKKEINKMKNGDLKGKIIYEEGNFYTVKLPELKYFLDEQKSFEDQSPFVKKALKKMLKENPDLRFINDFINKPHYNGGGFYDKLESALGSDKNASLKLNEYGLVGIKYHGNIDSDCVVMFNNDDIKLMKKATVTDAQEPTLPEKMAIEEDPYSIKNIENPSKELQLLAVNSDPSAITVIKNPDKDVLRKAFDYNVNLILKSENVPNEIIEEYAEKLDFYDILKLNLKVKDKKFIQKIIFKKIKSEPDLLGSFVSHYNFNEDDAEDIKFFESVIKMCKETLDRKQISSSLVSLNTSLSVPKITILQKYLYSTEPYDNLSDVDKNINYEVTNPYTIRGDINTFPSEIRHTCLSWCWKYWIEKINEFKEEDLETLKTNYKLGYLNVDSNWTRFNFNLNCKISDNVLKELLSFIKKISNEDIEIEYDNLVRYMDINDLIPLVNTGFDFYNIYTHIDDESKSLRDIFVLNVIKEKLTLNDVKTESELFDKITKNATNSLINIYRNSNINERSFVFMALLIKSLIWNGSYSLLYNVIEDCSKDIQKYLLKINVELIKYVKNVDENIQYAMIKKNPYLIKFINNPSPSVVQKASESIPYIDDYLR